MTTILFAILLAGEPGFAFTDDGERHLTLTERGAPVLVYNYGDLLPEGVPEDRRRQGYLHPLYGLDGEVLTDDFPKDHYHHRGLYFGWPGIRVGPSTGSGQAQEVDLWHLKGITRRFESWLEQSADATRASFGTQCGWFVGPLRQAQDFASTGSGQARVMDERTTYTVHVAGEHGRLIDVTETLVAQTDITLHPKDAKGYGGFLLRLAPRTQPTIRNADGVTPRDTDLVPSPWADQTGQFAGAPGRSGVAIFCHAANPGFPNGWCLRRYGYVGVSWPGDQEFQFPVGEPVVLRYRVYVHRGDAEEAGVAQAYEAYAAEP